MLVFGGQNSVLYGIIKLALEINLIPLQIRQATVAGAHERGARAQVPLFDLLAVHVHVVVAAHQLPELVAGAAGHGHLWRRLHVLFHLLLDFAGVGLGHEEVHVLRVLVSEREKVIRKDSIKVSF